jgi:hypothetical protein
VLSLLLLGPILAPACGRRDEAAGAKSPASQAESTRAMAARLREIAQDFRPGEDSLGGTAFFRLNRPWEIPALRQRLAAAPPAEAGWLHLKLAHELLFDGASEDALGEFSVLHAQLAAGSDPGAASVRKFSSLLRGRVAIALFRIGEQENCVARHTAESCIFPIQEGGRHKLDRGARGAMEVLGEELRENPSNLGARWLLNLAAMTLGAYPGEVPREWLISPEVFRSEHELPRFSDVATPTGTDVTGLAGGSIMDDFDGDGLLDLVTSSWGLSDQLRYLQNAGDGTFRDRTEDAGLSGETGGLNLCHADYDNDGFLDVLVVRGGWLSGLGRHPDSLLRNRGDGSFEDVTERAGLLNDEPGQTAAWADYDGDGDLDLFVGNETRAPNDPHPSQLFQNQGDGTFRDVAREVGLADLGWVKGAAWGDYQNDGRPDLYVSRMGQPNLLFRNEGAGSAGSASGSRPPWVFREVAQGAGVAEPRNSFPCWFWDYDNDGWLDIFVAGYDDAEIADVAALYLGLPCSKERPRLYRNLGDGSFRDVTQAARLDRVLLVMGANFGDLDADGFPDLYLGTGSPDLETLMPNRAFRNHAGAHFQDVSTAGGFGHLQKGHGIAFGDIDGDGDEDVYAAMGGWYTGDRFRRVLFENPSRGHRWITLRLEGVRSNRAAIGARIRVAVRAQQGERAVHAVVGAGGSFGCSSLQQEIGLGSALSIASIEVRWPASGEVQVFQGAELDRAYRIREGEDRLIPVPLKRIALKRIALEKAAR